MSKGIQFILKGLALVLALGLLGGYVWTRQRAAAPETDKTTTSSGDVEFPITPASPTLFDTSKSGKIDVDPVLFSTSKSGPIQVPVTLPETSKSTLDEKVPASSTSAKATDSQGKQHIVISGSKSLNMPVFNTKEITKVKTVWNGETVPEADSEGKKKEKPKGTQE